MSKGSLAAARHILFFSTALFAFAGIASAQDAPPPSTNKVEKVTVTAQKRVQNAQDIPSTVNAINAKSIKDLGINSSDKIAEFVPGVTIALPSGAGNQPIIAIRGVGNNDYNTNNSGPNGVYADEVYISAPSAQTFQAFDLDRIEVLKGPQGTLYGRNTSGGAINFISNKPTDEFHTGLTAQYGSFNTYELQGFINGATGDNSAGRLAFIWDKSDGFARNLVNGDRINGTDSFSARGLWELNPSEDFSLLFNFHGTKVDTLPVQYHHVGTLDPATLTTCSAADVKAGGLCTDLFFYDGPDDVYKGDYDRPEHLDVENEGGSVRADYDLGSFTLTSITALEHNDKLHPENTDAGPLSLIHLDFGVNSDTFTQEVRAAGESETMNWVVGLYYLGENLEQNQKVDLFHDLYLFDFAFGPGIGECPPDINDATPFCAITGRSQSKQETSAYAVFGQTDFEIFADTRLTLGGRYTTETRDFRLTGNVVGQTAVPGVFGAPQELWNGGFNLSTDDSAFSWRVALDHHFTDTVMAYASFATGFKSGVFNGGFLDVDPAVALAQVSPVRPETNRAYEIGIKADLLDDALRLNVSGFYYDYEDLQIHTLVTIPGGVVTSDLLDNAQKATIKGIDVDATATPFENFTLRLSAEWLDAVLDEYTSNRGGPGQNYNGNTLPNSPEFSFTAIANYTIPVGDTDAIDLLGSAAYRSKVFYGPDNDELVAQDAYWVFNARAAYTIDDGRWQVAVFGRNLGDEEYKNMGFNLSSFGLLQEIMAPPLTVGVEASFHY